LKRFQPTGLAVGTGDDCGVALSVLPIGNATFLVSMHRWSERGKSRYAEARMGKLLSLDRRRRAAPPKVSPVGEGEIVIFTGVRYERRAEPGHAGDPPPARPKRKRG
jgi:hypothetical protein